MPQDQIDWPGIRAAAVVAGVRRAAREAAGDLPPTEVRTFVNRVMRRASREHWLDKANSAKDLTPAGKPMSAPVRTGARSLENLLQRDNHETKFALSTAARKGAQTLAKMPGGKVLDRSKELKDVTSAASQVHGWDQRFTGVTIQLNVLNVER
jgi:hypothetical protein